MIAHLRAWRAEWVVWGLITLYVLFFGALTIQQHNAFQTTAFDLGNVDQAVWNTRHGRPFHMTNIEGLTNRLGTHVEPILLPISLFYFLWADPRALLLLQTVVVALGAWPVFLIGKREIGKLGNTVPVRRWGWREQVLALVFVAAYLLYPALQSANVFDFHAVALAPTLLLFAFYFLETERWGWYALFAVLTMSCKEDMPLLVAMLGLYAIIVRRKWLAGLATMAVAAFWFFVAVGVIMPHFDTRGVSPLANRYAYLGDSPVEMVSTLATRPSIWLGRLFTGENRTYMLKLLAPVAFLSVFAPQVLMLALPTLLVNLLSTDGFMHQLEGFHYGAILAPIVVVSAVYGTARLMRRFVRFRHLPFVLAAVVLVSSLFYHYNFGYTPLSANFSGTWPTVTDHHRLGEEIATGDAGGIPTEASLAALPHPNPHASQRQQLTMIDRVENGLPAPLNGADYVWLDATNSWPLHPNDLKTGVDNLLTGEYGIDQAVDGWLLLRHGASDRALPDTFYDFARTTNLQPQHPMHLQFLLDGEPILETLGFDLELAQHASYHPDFIEGRITFYWRALKPLPPGLGIYPFYFDDTTGEIVEDTSLRPMIATVWYPPERWQVGEIIQTSTLPWNVGSDFSVGLGVVQGGDWNNPEQRLPIHVESSDLVVRLFDDNTWARLLHVADGEPVEEYRSFEAPSPKHPLNANFDDQITLLDYNLDCNQKLSTCKLQLTWQAQTRLGTSYTTFAQLIDPAGNVRAQVDAVPQGGGYPTTWWLPGEVVFDDLILELPPDAPSDTSYRLIVGLYDPLTGQRLPVTGTSTDYVELPTDD